MKDVVPLSVPVRTVDATGRAILGVTIRNPFAVPSDLLQVNGARIRADGRGGFEVLPAPFWAMQSDAPSFAPGHEEITRLQNQVGVEWPADLAPEQVAEPAGFQWRLNLYFDPQNINASIEDMQDRQFFELSVQRVVQRFESLLPLNFGRALVRLEFDAAATTPNCQNTILTPSWSNYRDQLVNLAEANNESSQEVAFINPLPFSSVPIRKQNVIDVESLLMPQAHGIAMGFSPQPFTDDAVIRIPANLAGAFDYNPFNGFESPFVFEATLTHEVFHALGFTSFADTEIEGLATPMDSFRLSYDQALVGVGPSQVSTAPRELRSTHEAAFVWGFGAPAGHDRVARGRGLGGDGFQASHWKAFLDLVPQTPIGIMDPIALAQEVGAFVKIADLRMIDMIGWNLPLNILQGPGPAILVDPPNGSVLVAGATLFSWEVGSLTSSVRLSVFSGNVANDVSQVFHSGDLGLTTTATVPSGTLASGNYVWLIVSENSSGVVQSTIGTFEIVSACPADFNHDGDLNGDDLGDFLNCFFAVPPCPEADFNGDNTIDGDDLGDYINAFFAGCP